MSASIMLCRISGALAKFENSVGLLVSRLFPPGGPDFALAGLELPANNTSTSWLPSAKEILEDCFLRAVPRNRRSLEKRHKRRFGHLDHVWKMLWLKKNLQSCMQCGNFHEPGILCPHCYHKVIEETKQISENIQKVLKLDPVDKDVIVLYENEEAPEFHEGKRIVEMQKPRPPWFSKNLMESSTQEPNDTAKELKPKDLA
ncbi:hypothetical protein ONE63_007673 [Megalurothrips usitatus]|uniref:Large ribosomal subunit protein bL32m n=1 Tax=Megalurothrips usitatus TaxID=439358 RepID=A0AAV7XPG5_9NEOP|nr:hypothetical protein ONE63_007673 [Megalurothrips usitatus]